MSAAAVSVRTRRDLRLADGAVLAAVALAWVVALGAGLSGRTQLHGHEVAGSLTASRFLLFLMAWTAMVVAMMLPTALPMIRLFNRAAAGQPRAGTVRVGFLAAYLAVWILFGVAALLTDMGLHRGVEAWEWLRVRPWLLPGGSLLAAGLFQFSDLKMSCLTECRHPAAYLLRHYSRGLGAAIRMGIGHGVFCLGCCWALMLLMFAMGVANLAWMAALTLMMVVEKNLPGGERSVRILGVGLVALAILVLAQPGWLPAGLQYSAEDNLLAGQHAHI